MAVFRMNIEQFCRLSQLVGEKIRKQNTNYRRAITPEERLAGFFKVRTIKSGTAVAQWLRCCATNRKVAGSIPVGVSGFFIDIKSFRSHYGPGVDSASNRNEYQEHFLGVKAAGA